MDHVESEQFTGTAAHRTNRRSVAICTHRLVFMGTPRFGQIILAALLGHYEIVGVLTQPDRKAGRGRKVAISPVKALALENDLPLLQPRTLREEAVVEQLRQLEPAVIVVAAFGQILPPSILSLPSYGAINVHASLLPRHRGAAPIPAAILASDERTGITIMLMDEGLDTGPILSQQSLEITAQDTTPSLTEKLGHLGAELLLDTLPRWLAGEVSPQQQDDGQATYAPVLRKEQGRIDWSAPAELIARRCRAFYPWPGAFTTWQGERLKVLAAHPISAEPSSEVPGSVMQFDSDIAVVTGEGLLVLEELQLAGRRPASAQDFAHGQRTFVGSVLE
jgi:methionyl-tRNA formyltransferase